METLNLNSMGQAQSVPAAHLRIYQNVLAMKSPGQKAQIIQTILASPEHVETAKRAGLYGYLLHYVKVVEAGGAPPKLPGEDVGISRHTTFGEDVEVAAGGGAAAAAPSQQGKRMTEVVQRPSGAAFAASQALTTSSKSNEKAMNYFSACLRILALEEEVALTEDLLKAAYKKAVVRAHPDKGGSDKEFEAVTRAYAYLGEILRRIHGGRAKEGVVQAPSALHSNRATEADAWKHVDPVALNPKNLDMGAFNKMFEQTRLPDPEEEGYGDWLKGEEADPSGAGSKFSGKFNREVFHRMFEEEQQNKAKRTEGKGGGVMVVQEMSLASRMGYATELGRGAKEDYTVAPHEGKMAYTDLKKAYTTYNTISHEVAGVKVDARSLEQMNTERKGKVIPLSDPEMMALREAESMAARAEEQRKLRMAQQAIQEQDHFERMKRLVIRN